VRKRKFNIFGSYFIQGANFVNEFKILNNIGKGSFSKVKKVLRIWADEDSGAGSNEKLFAMKVSLCFHLIFLR